MAEQFQDKIIVFEDFKEYNISYPVIVTRWEIKQVHGLNKQYLQVYFQKISDTVKAFKFNAKCYSSFGEVIEEITDISIQEVDKKSIQFSEVVPLKSETRKVELNLKQCLLLDNFVIEPKGRQIAINNFKPFSEEDLEAGQRLLPSAKGFPVDNVSHWYCACGVLHSSDTQSCLNCNKSKKEIYSLITSENIKEEKIKLEKRECDNSSKRKIKKLVLTCFTFVALLFTLISLTFYINLSTCRELGPVTSESDVELISAGFYLILIIPILLIITDIVGFFIFNDKIFKMIELATIIICLVLNAINTVIKFTYDFYSYIFFVPLLLNLPFTIGYFVCNIEKVFDRIYKWFKKIKKDNK